MVEHRSPKPGAGGSSPSTPAISFGKETTMTNEQTGQMPDKSKISEFIRETKREIAKVTWPTRKEIWMTTVLIIVFALMMGVFFLVVDWVLGFTIPRLLGMQS